MFVVFFFFKQKTAYEMRISDWSSDVCSSDLARRHGGSGLSERRRSCPCGGRELRDGLQPRRLPHPAQPPDPGPDRLGAGGRDCLLDQRRAEIGRASWWGRVGPYV